MTESFTAEDRALAAWEIAAASMSALAAEWVVYGEPRSLPAAAALAPARLEAVS